ncbi:hypothetical protein EW146_g195 [Bondarzewia mesenterica]|uniref:Uncharacterized protein n=1 Tax=Bondarzewia mesenterica TaxID=1095465 RepID=A0A4V6S1L7_9AGAM|nr:hypothetical protein EW146_g195 [Bondarzewia mesenterica]
METIGDADKIRLTFVPTTSTYVAFSIDPVFTVAALDDPEASAAAKAISTKKYAGYVSEVLDLPFPDRLYHRCEIRLLSQGLPELSDEHHIEPSMCVPVFPTTEHPLSREPLHPTKPLPWPNLYHHSYMDVTLRLRTHVTDCSMAPRIPPKDRVRHDRMISEDDERREDLERKSKEPSSPNERSPTESQMGSSMPIAVGSSSTPGAAYELRHSGSESSSSRNLQNSIAPHDGFVGDSDAGDAHSNLDSDSDVAYVNNLFWGAMFGGNDSAYDTMPVADVWYDISVVDKFTNPRHLFIEIDALKKIDQESRVRNATRMEEFDKARLASIPQPDETQAELRESQRIFYRPLNLITWIQSRLRDVLSTRNTRASTSPDPETIASLSPKKPLANFKRVVKLAISAASCPIVSLMKVVSHRSDLSIGYPSIASHAMQPRTCIMYTLNAVKDPATDDIIYLRFIPVLA